MRGGAGEPRKSKPIGFLTSGLLAITDACHYLSQHGKSAARLNHLEMIERVFAVLKSTQKGADTLLDRPMILSGSNQGNANTYVASNLPVLLTGGGFKHGQHFGFDRDRNYPLPKFFVSVVHRLGVESDKFASSTGPIRSPELV
jgi:hypothetical protein